MYFKDKEVRLLSLNETGRIGIVEPYINEIKKYCRILAMTPWDSEDLFQESMLKVHRSLHLIEKADNVKSYLFRTVTNTWMDYFRKNKVKFEPYEDDYQAINIQDRLEVEVALELLICELPPLQSVVFLLSDIFHFTARETAEMIQSNENAVKSALFRARKNIRSLSLNKTNNRVSDQALLEAFISAFHYHDPFVIGRAYQALVKQGYSVQRTKATGKLVFVITDPDGNKLLIS